ncbi:hypothetical protein V6N12_058435 [Hibiscus sabdariffa]|uniref:Uncharacterized protein n=1 Tax=Hibiscus sabdariffa TaxID=183260 RepID=A0ABR2ES48_9ROSI
MQKAKSEAVACSLDFGSVFKYRSLHLWLTHDLGSRLCSLPFAFALHPKLCLKPWTSLKLASQRIDGSGFHFAAAHF